VGHSPQLYGFSSLVSIKKTRLTLVFFLSSSNRNRGKVFVVFSKKCDDSFTAEQFQTCTTLAKLYCTYARSTQAIPTEASDATSYVEEDGEAWQRITQQRVTASEKNNYTNK
jgi:hypothetical protein